MAEGITASSMGQAIGLGYRTKDIGPQLMQFQAADLARKASERSAEKKEKKAEYDKTLDKIIDLSGADVHKVFRGELNKIADDAKSKVTKANNEGDYQGMKEAIFDMNKAVSDYKLKTTNLRGIETAASTGSQLVPNDVISTFSGDKFVEMPKESQEYMLSLGWEVDPLNRMYTNKAGFKPKDTLNEIMTSPMPTKEVLIEYGSNPEFKKDPNQTGFSMSGYDVFVPTLKYWDAVVNAKLQDGEFVANELMRITNNDGKSYAKVAAEKRAAIAATKGVDPATIPIIDVNRAIVKDNLDNTIRDTWIKNHTLGDNRNIAPKVTGGGGGGGKKDKVVPNSADIQTFEGFSGTTRATIMKLVNEARKRDDDPSIYEGIEKKTDAEIAQIIQNDNGYVFGNEKQVLKNPKDQSYGVVISSTTENIDIPSLGKGGQTVALSSIKYNKNTQKFYATAKGTVTLANGIVKAAQEIQFELTDQDLRAIKNKAKSVKEIEAGVESYNANANSFAMPTIDAYLKGQRTVTLTKQQVDKGYASEKAKNPNLKLDDYKKFLKAQKFTLI